MNTNDQKIEAARREALDSFLGLRSNCTEALLRSLRNHLDLNLSDEQLAIATGFGGGMGAGCACGTLTGAVIAVSLENGRKPGVISENPPKASLLAKELHDFFKENHQITCCRGLIPGLKKGDPERTKRCSQFVDEMTKKAADIILRERENRK